MTRALSHPRWSIALLAVALLTGWGAAPAGAVDGVIEINQARALAGDVTPSDTAGFPVTIDTPGSYRLTGNLSVPDANTTAILVTTDHVSLDLNGFGLVGPGGAGPGRGVDATNKQNIAVTNGTVRGFGNSGIIVGPNSQVEHVRAVLNGTIGIIADSGSTVSGNTAQGNGGRGIFTGNGTTVSGNTAQANGFFGIDAGAGSTVSGNTARLNGSNGISAGLSSTVSGNTALSNAGAGISASTGSTVTGNTAGLNTSFGLNLGTAGYAQNVLNGNNGGNANPQVSGGIQIGTNLCGTDTICP